MSLINDMLQDLDSRKHLQNTDSVSDAEIADAEITVAPNDSAAPRAVWIFLGLLLAAFIGFWLVQPLVTGFGFAKPTPPQELVDSVTEKDEDTATTIATTTAIKIPVEPPVAAVDTAQVINTENTHESINNIPVEVIAENIVAVAADKHQAQIEKFLSAAEVALNNNRLSLPRGQSAYDLYRRVIAIDANNAQALDGLQKVKTRYAGLIEDALAATEFKRAKQLVNRVENLSLTFRSFQLENYRNRIQEQLLAAQSASAEPSETTSVAVDNQNNADTYLAINKTLVSRELALARETQQLFALGRGTEAAAQLEHFISDNATANLSRILLFDFYLDQTQLSRARKVMEPVHAMDAATLAYMQARLAMMSSGAGSAIALLEKQKPEENIAEIYNTLLAGLYQKEKSHGKAAALYASLIELNPSSVTYWLGMGISRDALGEHQPALNAYNVVLAHKNLDEKVRNFVKTRIQALSSQELAEAAW